MPVWTSTSSVIDTSSPETGEHFLLYFYSMMTRILRSLDQGSTSGDAHLQTIFEKFPFLNGYRDTIHKIMPPEIPESNQDQWWQQYIASWEARQSVHLPLRSLAAAVGQQGVWYILAAGIIEEDLRFGSLFAVLQEPLQFRRPCLGLLGWLLSDSDAWRTSRPLIEGGLLIVENRDESRAEWLLHLPPPIWDALRTRISEHPAPGLTYQPASSFPQLPDLILLDETHDQVWNAPDLMRTGQISALVVRGMTYSGRRTLLGSIARVLQRDVLLYEGKPEESRNLIGPLATLLGAMPILRCNPGPGETIDLSQLQIYDGPVGITLGRSGGLRGQMMQHALTLTLPPPDYEARRSFWKLSGIPIEPADLNEIASRFLITGGTIQRAAVLGYTYTTLDKRTSLTATDVQTALRALNRQTLDTLATHLDSVNGWADCKEPSITEDEADMPTDEVMEMDDDSFTTAGVLVVSDAVCKELNALKIRCNQRERLREEAGAAFNNNLNRGVRAMFSGPSGTGKTLAARALAGVLQMDLYRVDLAAVINKYIGETERNLNEVFSRAEELDVILLLDEGDSLMTKRTDVSNSNDRYANLETNYLLQRLETYEGIVIITTNAAQRIDNAFLRRLDVVIDFGKPEYQEREILWKYHLPSPNAITPKLMQQVITLCLLTGGQIRNVALYATQLALDADQLVSDKNLKAALEREYRNAGASYPLEETTAVGSSQLKRLQDFAKELG